MSVPFSQFPLGAVQDGKAFPDHGEFLQQALAWQFQWVEFKYERSLDPQTLLLGKAGQALGRRAADAGIGISVHAPYDEREPINLGDADPAVRRQSRGMVQRSIHFAANVRARYITLHGVYSWLRDVDDTHQLPLRLRIPGAEFEDMRQRFQEDLVWLCSEAAAVNVHLAVENFYDSPLARGKIKFPVRPDHVKQCLRMAPQSVKFMYDLGHGNSLGLHPADYLDMVGPEHVVGTHVHDNDGSKDRHWTLGQGNLDLYGFLHYAKARELSFPLNLEMKNEQDLRQSQQVLRRCIDFVTTP